MNKIIKVESGSFNSANNDVVITLDDGRIINVSPEFSAINIFKSRADFDEFDLSKATTFDL